MYIQNLCKQLVYSSDKYVNFRCDGESSEELKKRYDKIKSYLSNKSYSTYRVGVLVKKDFIYLLIILASMELGLTFVPLNKKWPKAKNSEIASVSKCDFVITDESGFEKSIQVGTVFLDNSKSFKKDFIKHKNPLYIIFTSGSTGKPKGVVISRRAYSNFLKWTDSYFQDICFEDRVLNIADFTFDLALMDIAILLTKRVRFFISKFDNDIFKLILEIQSKKITTVSTVPNTISMMLSSKILTRADISSLKYLLLGGAKFSNGLYIKLFDKFKKIKIFNLYGPTEATVYCAIMELKNHSSEIVDSHVSIGKPISNMEIVIQNTEVFISGVQLMDFYLDEPGLTQKVFKHINNKKYYATGDLGFKDSNDNFFIIGRADDTIKCSGYRINLSDIDSLISKLPYVDDCATIAKRDEYKENILIAYIKTNQKVEENRLYEDMIKFLAPYQVPVEVHFVDKFPLNSSGKISKKALSIL